MIKLAVLADPHLHDTRFGGEDDGRAVRSLAESLHSTRIFNESGPALRRMLAQVAEDRVGICLIVGDLTDDGQPANWAAASAVLADHSARHGTRFFACPGNHDQWAVAGKPLVKGCVDAVGRTVAIAGDGAAPCAGMRMVGYAEAMQQAGALGYRRDPRDLHWETPFGTSDRVEDREAEMVAASGERAPVFDASYLVEPVPGLWILSVDANVYLPDGRGGFTDRSPDGWSAAVAHKPYLLPWMTGVATRARQLGKRLVTFSHYPVTDVFSGSVAALDALGGRSSGRRRMPDPGVAEAIAATGIGLHFSGHWHVDATAADATGRVVNVAVPSAVAFPAGWKLLEIDGAALRIHDRPLDAVPGWDRWHDRYRAEARLAGRDVPALGASDYTGFLDRHFRAMVLDRRLAEDWPPEMADLVGRLTLADLPGDNDVPDLPLSEVFVDWYRLRETGGCPAAGVPMERRDLYAALARSAERWDGAGTTILATFFRTLGAHLSAGPAGRRVLDRLAQPATAEC